MYGLNDFDDVLINNDAMQMMRDQTGYSAVYTLQLRGTLVIVHVVYEFWIQWFVVRITFGNSKQRSNLLCRVY